jgi:hypothetical protein
MKIVLALLLLSTVLGLAGLAAVCYAAGEADARSAVANADQRVSACYLAVADAQKAGANVSGLVSTLNDAGLLLSRAHLALAGGNFDSASALATQCVAKLDGFEGGADGLRVSASQARFMDFVVNIVGSAVGAVVVVVGGVLIWLYLKGRNAVKVGEV